MKTAREAVQEMVDMSLGDARQAEELLEKSEATGSPILQELIEDAFTLAAAGQKVLGSSQLETYSAEEAVVIVALEAMSLVRQEEKAGRALLPSTKDLLH